MGVLDNIKSEQVLDLFTNPVKWCEAFLRDPNDKEKPFQFVSYQRNIEEQTRNYRNIILRFGRRCLPGYSPILMYDGTIKTLNDIAIGDAVVSRTSNAQPIKGTVINKFSNGIKPVYRITLNDGRFIDCTDNHPLLSWVPVSNNSKTYHYEWKSIVDGLKKGDKLVALKKWEKFGELSNQEEAKLLGYLVTDGHIDEKQTPKFTSSTYSYILEVQKIVKNIFGYCCTIKKRKESSCWDIHLTDKNKQTINAVSAWLKKIGIRNKKDKHEQVFKYISNYDRNSLSLFLNRLWSGDGCVSLWTRKNREHRGKAVVCSITSHNLKFLNSLQILLYKIGVRSRIKYEVRKSPSSDNMCANWTLHFSDKVSVVNFLKFTGPIYGKEQQSIAALNELDKRREKNKGNGSVFYYKSKIKSIVLIGDIETYDITIDKYHNFTVNGIVTHNSGKSVLMCADTLWWSSAYPLVRMIEEKRQRQLPFTIIIATPYETQIKELWTTYFSLIADSPLLREQIVKIRTSDVHTIEFDNGSIIKGYTIGISSSNRGTSLRSLSADMLFLDEMDFIPREIVEQVIMPIWTTHAQCRFRICSTPSGERGLFYTWCQNALENGWLHSHIPSWHPDNKRWLSIETAKKQGIPITESTEYQVKAITSAANYEREYGAEFGEEFGGVYKNHLLNRCLKKYGRDININNPDIFDPGFKQNINNYYIIGVDWNSYINGGQVVLMEYCRDRTVEQFFDDNQGMDVTIDFTGKYRLFYRRGITSKDSTQRKTREEIIRLFKIYKIDYIYVDYGAGDTNIEELTLFGRDHPELQLNRKLKVIDSGASVEHFDPVLGRLVKKRNKSLMVNFSALNLEENMYILPKEEDEPTRLVGQMRGYQVKNVTNRGDYTYEGDDHILDAFNLAIYGFQKEYGSILNNKIAYRIIFMNDPRFKDYPTRVQEVTDLSIISAKPSRKTHDPEKVIQRPRMPVHISMPRARPNINFRNRNSF